MQINPGLGGDWGGKWKYLGWNIFLAWTQMMKLSKPWLILDLWSWKILPMSLKVYQLFWNLLKLSPARYVYLLCYVTYFVLSLQFIIWVLQAFAYLIQVYGDNSMIPNIADLRWKLFRMKNLEGESLPPTRHALFQHCLRANSLSQRDKSYTEKCPKLPDYTKCSFKGSR